MNKMNISKIISGKPDKGLNKYMLEEVYFSESCFNKGEYNPQNAKFINGRYYFDLPDFWYNHLSNNKAIALRKIDLHAPALEISFDLHVERLTVSNSNIQRKNMRISVSAQPNQPTQSVLDAIEREVNQALGNNRWSGNPEYTIRMANIYNYETHQAEIGMIHVMPLENPNPNLFRFAFQWGNLSTGCQQFLNCVGATQTYFEAPTAAKDGTMYISFANVWNREFLFVHASFVNGTSFNYLGRSGEFYPKPSKMYRFGGSSQQFYFELSLNGRTPIDQILGNFCIDLAFIYHDKDYQAE